MYAKINNFSVIYFFSSNRHYTKTSSTGSFVLCVGVFERGRVGEGIIIRAAASLSRNFFIFFDCMHRQNTEKDITGLIFEQFKYGFQDTFPNLDKMP